MKKGDIVYVFKTLSKNTNKILKKIGCYGVYRVGWVGVIHNLSNNDAVCVRFPGHQMAFLNVHPNELKLFYYNSRCLNVTNKKHLKEVIKYANNK